METTVSLVQMLDARERRVQHQQALLAQYHKPLICFTMNICGPVKDSPLIRRGFARGRQLLRQQFLRAKLVPLREDAIREVTGCEAFYVLDADPLTIKKFTTDIEDATPLGRLFDMDVIRPDGRKVDREELHLEGRRCLICGGPAKVCSSRRVHTVAELQEKTTEILTDARDAQDIADAARLSVRALLYEVTTTPKPGLVDRRNSGSHKDMDVFTFMDSAAALYPYFEACARMGCGTAERPASETFEALRPLGCEAEGEMLEATGGVNTHKGAVFSVGIVCAALGRLVLDFIKKSATVQYDEAMIEAMEKHAIQDGKKGSGSADSDEEGGSDPMLKQAVEVVIDAGQASTSLLQRRCKLGYARAARIMDEMEEKGIIGPYEGAKPRAVLISRQQWLEMQMNQPDE